MKKLELGSCAININALEYIMNMFDNLGCLNLKYNEGLLSSGLKQLMSDITEKLTIYCNSIKTVHVPIVIPKNLGFFLSMWEIKVCLRL
jgi:hypothetical protein